MSLFKFCIVLLSGFLVFDFSLKAQFIEKAAFDESVKPGNNFFEYVNGGWIKNNTIPPSEISWGALDIIDKQTRTRLHELLTGVVAQSNPAGSEASKLAALFKSGMDTVLIEKSGMTPLIPGIARINRITDLNGVMNEVITQYRSGFIEFSPMMSFYAIPDPVNNDIEIASFEQGGMGLPTKTFYLDIDSTSISIRNKYLDYLTTLLKLTGAPANKTQSIAADILKLETKLARNSRTPEQNRDVAKLLNYYTFDSLQKSFPGFSWKSFFDKLGINKKRIMISQPEFFKGLDSAIASTPVETWRYYLKVKLATNASPYLSSPFSQAYFEFYSKALYGSKEMRPRWEKVILKIDKYMGDPLGKLYVKKYFPPAAKKRIDSTVLNLIAAFRERIVKLDWLSDSTRQKAVTKLSAIATKIGYPEKWEDYSLLTTGKNYYLNIELASRLLFNQSIARIGKPIDRTRWEMSAPTLNAYYNPLKNEIVFPAGILLYPMFDKDADDAVNYGAIGMIIGHEISHGFDDQGSLFDAQGKFSEWWTADDKDKFRKKGDAMANQFSQYIAVDTLHVNGRLTLGENIADLCGLTVAYDAFKKTAQGMSDEKIDGFTPNQRFFISMAQVWRMISRPETIRTRILSDPHSPEETRVNGTVSNMTPFYQAFNIDSTDKMYIPPSKRLVIW